MSKMRDSVAAPEGAVYDFYKTNGGDYAFKTEGPSVTRQEFAEECDINTIMSKYDGYLSDPTRSVRPPMYIDFTQLPDTLMGTMAMVHEASEAFFRLPALVRKEFDNDPVAFADFAADPVNIDQLRDWGLAKPKAVPPAPAAPSAAPGAASAAPAAPGTVVPGAPSTHAST